MSNNNLTFNLRGTVHLIRNTDEINNGFRKREVIIEVTGNAPQFIRMEAHNKMCTELDSFKPQDIVDVTWTLKGKPYQGKYFTNLVIKSIALANGATRVPATPAPATPKSITHPDDDVNDNVLF
jgi:ribosomal protein L3